VLVLIKVKRRALSEFFDEVLRELVLFWTSQSETKADVGASASQRPDDIVPVTNEGQLTPLELSAEMFMNREDIC
ncbi:MAG: hypothetical protein RL069_2576, partial [Planctomycetota bacterium]